MKKLIIIYIALFSPLFAAADSLTDRWNHLLEIYVRSGTIDGVDLTAVNYFEIRKDKAFKQIIKDLETAPVPADQQEAMAFWINVYNILAISVVADAYPVKSINDLGNWFSKVWDKEAGVVAGKQRTLNEVEHEILRKMGDPRIHAAIVCASVSCPDLRPEAYYADRLNVQLDEQMVRFLANPTKGARMDVFGRSLELSKIFDWFKEDFTDVNNLLPALKPYLPPEIATAVSPETNIKFMDYDWTLNDSLRFK